MKIKKLGIVGIAWILCLGMMMWAGRDVAVHAEQDSSVMEVPESQQAEDSKETTEVAATETLTPVEQVNRLISAIDEENPKMSSVMDARDAYAALTMAQKTQVTDYARLHKAELALGLARETTAPVLENTDTPDMETEKNGQRYSFRTNKYLNAVTLAVRYTTDLDQDGRMDIPDVTIITTDGRTLTPTVEDILIEDPSGEIHLSWSSVMMQMDVTGAVPGVFTVKTSNPVTFILSEYEEEQMVQFQGEENEEKSEEKTEDSVAAARNKGLLVMGLFIGGVAAVLIALNVLTKKIFGVETEKEKEKKKGNSHGPKPMSDEEEVELIKMEWENMKGDFKDEEPEPEDKKEEIDDDDRLSMTIEDLSDDDSIEEITDENGGFDGFFGKPRF